MRSHDKGTAHARPTEDLHWARLLACRLIRCAARSAPPSLSERLEEEWLADLAAQPGTIAGLCFAVGCCWATHVIACEHFDSNRPVVAAATGSKIMTLLPQNALLPRRTSALLLVVSLHVLLIYAFASGLASRVLETIPPPMLASVLQDPRKIEQPPLVPPPSRPTFPRIEPLPWPDTVDVPPDAVTCCQQPIGDPSSPASPPTPRAVIRVQGGPAEGFPHTEDYYPPSAIRLGQQGAAAVRVCVNDKGALTSEPTLAQSSSIASIDAGALRLAKAGSGHYRATTEDGHPVSSCYTFFVRFALTN
jgi:periplasmic protein TonB